jgi:uncharacterized protein YbbC (DUF1343 family)
VRVELPIDHLDELWPEKFRGARIGALLHPASVSSKLQHASRVLERYNGDLFRLSAFFGPQHGLLGQTQDDMVEWKGYEHPRLRIPVFSLYGEHREPTTEMLQDIDVLLVDLQDVGARYYTFIWTMYLCMRACEQNGVAVVLLDRPNPINGVTAEGPSLNADYKSFVGLHPVPVRHGKTIGQLAQQFRKIGNAKCGSTKPVCRGSCHHRTCRHSIPRPFIPGYVCSKAQTSPKDAAQHARLKSSARHS